MRKNMKAMSDGDNADWKDTARFLRV